MIMNPADQSHAKQVGILQQVRYLFVSILVYVVDESSSLCCCTHVAKRKQEKEKEKEIRSQEQHYSSTHDFGTSPSHHHSAPIFSTPFGCAKHPFCLDRCVCALSFRSSPLADQY